jgi:hypothetical protein
MNGIEGKRMFPVPGAADWISLAAAPTFAVMALLTGILGGKPVTACSVEHGASPLSGMAPMYLLMGALNSPPWLRLISRRHTRRSSQIGVHRRR